jgi:hypothetical protein
MKQIWCCIQKNYRLRLFIPVLALAIVQAVAQGNRSVSSCAYRDIFGDSYREAEEFFFREIWMTDSLCKYGVTPALAKAIVFPELIRYSSIRNYLEMQGLYSLYVQYGKRYANFSVGSFQMKPDFAEQLEKEIIRIFTERLVWHEYLDTSDTPGARLRRVQRLNDKAWQLRYLIAFIQIMDARYGRTLKPDMREKVRFYATAYNCGYSNPAEVILSRMDESYFHTSLFPGSERYNYADIALCYFLLLDR